MVTTKKTARTLAYYDAKAESYAHQTLALDMSATRKRLTDELLPGAHILDAGCGAGRDSKAFLDAGFRVTAFDGSAALASIASRHIGQPVFVRLFQDVDFAPQFDGIYASASLLHLDDEELVDALQRLFRSLRTGGRLLALFKLGAGLRDDEATGRMFNDMNPTRIVPFVQHAGGRVLATHIDQDTQGRGINWISVVAAHA